MSPAYSRSIVDSLDTIFGPEFPLGPYGTGMAPVTMPFRKVHRHVIFHYFPLEAGMTAYDGLALFSSLKALMEKHGPAELMAVLIFTGGRHWIERAVFELWLDGRDIEGEKK